MENLMMNLFKGHMAASDEHFFFCIKIKKDKHDEGKGISEEQLMNSALSKCVNKKLD